MNTNKTMLSKSILEMKFMRRTKQKVEQQQFQEEGEEYFGSGLTERMKKDTDRFIIEPSYVFCEKLIDGRVSYQGMNPEIEKIMEAEQVHKRIAQETKDETDVSDEQMMRQWKSFRKNVKTENKRSEFRYERKAGTDNAEPAIKRRKFLKPQD